MKTLLRNLARRWAGRVIVRTNDDLRRKLIAAEAAVERLKQERDAANIANANLSTYNAQMARLLNEAINENARLRRVIADADNTAARDEAGQDAPRPQCPEALLLDGVELHRCIRDGGHEGDHWNRGHQRQWPQVEVDENIEVPW